MASAKAARNGPTKKEFIAVVQMPSKMIERVALGEVTMRVMSRASQASGQPLSAHTGGSSVADHPEEWFGHSGSTGSPLRMRLENAAASSSGGPSVSGRRERARNSRNGSDVFNNPSR